MSEYNSNAATGWVCFDAGCPFCVRWANRLRGPLEHRGFGLIPLQSDWVRRVLSVSEDELLREMRVITRRGEVFGGADAVLFLAQRIGWARPLCVLAGVPGVKPLLERAYRFVAANRTCRLGTCSIDRPGHGPRAREIPESPRSLSLSPSEGERAPKAGEEVRTFPARMMRPEHSHRAARWSDIVPLIALTSIATLLGGVLRPWVWMWTLALALFAGCKWLTFRAAVRRGLKPATLRALGYLLVWPGMDPRPFFLNAPSTMKPSRAAWLRSSARVVLGVIVLMTAPRWLLPGSPLAAGWTGMLGVVLLLHFGLFDILALAWQSVGVNASPLMDRPLRSCSLADFWSRRWNTAFHRLAHDFAFRPLRRRLGTFGATVVVFTVSGLVHELVISVPARGGYGLPTLYFLAQGAGVLFERTRLGRRLRLGREMRGWIFTVTVAAAPAFWLFPPPFIHHVILPMLRDIGAT